MNGSVTRLNAILSAALRRLERLTRDTLDTRDTRTDIGHRKGNRSNGTADV